MVVHHHRDGSEKTPGSDVKIGITGHTNLTPASEELVRSAIRDALTPYRTQRLTGVTCLAKGPDQVFAQVVREVGGDVAVVLPSPNYREVVVEPANLALFDALVSAASEVTYLPFDEPGRDAYLAASEELVARSDLVLAVWDGGHSGTAEAVSAARKQGRQVIILWPEGAERG